MRSLGFACPRSYSADCSSLLGVFAGAGVQEDGAVGPDLREVKHLNDRVGDAIERSLADALAAEPVIFDEVDDRGLIGDGVVDEILPPMER